MNPRKPAIAFASSSSASITSSSGAQGSEDFRLHVAVKRLIGRRCLPHQAWRRLSGGAVAFLGPERRRPTVYYSSSLPAAPAHARRLRGRGGGGRPGGVPAISFVCSCDSTSKRALERARSGAADVPRLLLRQYVQESFGAPGGHGWSGADRRKGPEENECGSLAMAGSWGSS